ncbi:Lrp/AsnC family transcriptional regulator [Kitasatospora sp. NPDC052896]|uniref:Lrp/AsnC family transcriptional regulator n=1 Tax=Kitasatospora sp. NPDC052896 TaxID=3364061 RepID=UPI0037C63FAE
MDSLDRQLVHALHVDGRAPFSRIAEVLGVSDQTIARRYRRLHQAGALGVLGRLDARRLGHVEWVVRLQCAPGSSGAVAEALAKRDDTYWVRLASGGAEVVCTVQADSERNRDALFLKKLPATRPVTAISAHCIMHTFRGGPTGWRGAASALAEQQAARLALPPVAPGGCPEPIALDEGDRALLGELARDGRATHAALAAATGWHEATVRRRIAALRASGTLYFDIDVDDRLLGYASPALLWISVEPSRLAAVGEALAQHPEIPFATATTGPTNLLASVLCPDVYALYDYITNRVGPLPGIRAIESAPIIRTVKRAGSINKPRLT